MLYYAHTQDKAGKKEPVIDHLKEVAFLTKRFASVWGADKEGYVAGLFHDIGKYSELFQDILERRTTNVDHATPGALSLIKKYQQNAYAAALAIEGHHEGIKLGDPGNFLARIKMNDALSETAKKYSERDIDLLMKRLQSDQPLLPETVNSNYITLHRNNLNLAAMLYTRMLFSALTDADFLATEAHFQKTNQVYAYRRYNQILDSDKADKVLKQLLETIDGLRSEGKKKNTAVQEIRDDLLENCLKGGEDPQGIYTLTAPTGAGKTYSMLAFALKHVKKHNLRRIIFVLPYLNIIDQMAKQFKELVKDLDQDIFILEDHSLAEFNENSDMKYLTENWDAPIVVTTTVKFFDSLFANRSTACRKLHNIADSIILFDEAQTMPVNLAPATLATILELEKRYGCTIVFSTATQPAFTTLNQEIKKYTLVDNSWHPQEIVDNNLRLFQRSKKVEVNWRKEPISWQDLAKEIAVEKQVLSVVNLRAHAKELYQAVKEIDTKDKIKTEGIFHLSTDMCPAHRLDTLEQIKNRLKYNDYCRLISTQCVEAGVDLDFPAVYRAFAPLDAIVQAAGRCNRNGREAFGRVEVFMPQAEKYPSSDYEKATVEVKRLLLEKGDIDISSPEVLREYYSNYFSTFDTKNKSANLYKAIKSYNYPETAKLYNWIPQAGINVLVPYEPHLERYERLCEIARNRWINNEWLREARTISVNVFAGYDSPIFDYLEPVKDRDGIDTGWYILVDRSKYSSEIGLFIEKSLNIYIS